jgi:hypothetical protein
MVWYISIRFIGIYQLLHLVEEAVFRGEGKLVNGGAFQTFTQGNGQHVLPTISTFVMEESTEKSDRLGRI